MFSSDYSEKIALGNFTKFLYYFCFIIIPSQKKIDRISNFLNWSLVTSKSRRFCEKHDVNTVWKWLSRCSDLRKQPIFTRIWLLCYGFQSISQWVDKLIGSHNNTVRMCPRALSGFITDCNWLLCGQGLPIFENNLSSREFD